MIQFIVLNNFSFSFQCPARWATLTCVVMPVMLDNSDWEYSNFASPNYYCDPIQQAFQKVISRRLIKIFNMFKYFLDDASGSYFPHLEKPVDSCIGDVIGFMKEEIEKIVEYVENEIEDQKTKPGKKKTLAEMTETLQKFHSCCTVLNIGCLGCMILDTTLQGKQKLELSWIDGRFICVWFGEHSGIFAICQCFVI